MKFSKRTAPLLPHPWVGPNDRNTFGNAPWNDSHRKISHKDNFYSIVSYVWKIPISWELPLTDQPWRTHLHKMPLFYHTRNCLWLVQFFELTQGRARGLGCFRRDVFSSLFSYQRSHSSSPSTQKINTKQSELSHIPNVQKINMWRVTKRVVGDTTGLLSSNWSKITFIFRIRSVARLWRGQRLISLEKKMKNTVLKRAVENSLI